MQRVVTIVVVILIALVALFARWQLFSSGALYGQTASKMASLVAAGVIVGAGSLVLRVIRMPGTPEATLSALAALTGLAVSAYGLAELVAPNTPVAAAAPACDGAPVYGARYFAQTGDGILATARVGPGREYEPVNRYRSGCTLGFDGYCIGEPVEDIFLGNGVASPYIPDQRWLVVHDRHELISAAVVRTQSREALLGEQPHQKCGEWGGMEQPRTVSTLAFRDGKFTAKAADAIIVGFALYYETAHGPETGQLDFATDPSNFSVAWTVPRHRVLDNVKEAWVSATICLASGAPSHDSLRAVRITLDGKKKVRTAAPAKKLSPEIRRKLETRACVYDTA